VKRAPRIWRKRRGRNGKFYGSCYVTLKGEDVNLGTEDNEIARQRLPAAMKGKRDFERDVDAAAAASEPGVEGAAAGITDAPAIQSQGPDPASAAAAPSAPAVPLQLPALPPANNNADAQAEAEATNAAAAETAGAAGGAEEPLEADALFPPEALDGMLEACAGAVVELQLELQAWVIKKRTGKIAGRVPEDNKIRPLAAQAWVAQLKRWFPDMDTVPPWVIAVALPAMCLPAQMANATDPPKEAEKQADPMPAQAAA
jgi:hypothetical protein